MPIEVVSNGNRVFVLSPLPTYIISLRTPVVYTFVIQTDYQTVAVSTTSISAEIAK